MSNSQNSRNISRRNFLALAGGAVGAATIASMGIPTSWAANNREIDIDKINQHNSNADVLVIGGGMAGLFAAVKAHDAGAKVMLVSKGQLGSSGQTPFAKGFFTYDPKKSKYTIDQFVKDVSISAENTNNKTYTKQVAENSLARAKELKEWGFFDSVLCNKPFRTPMDERNIPIMERIVITHLIKENGKIAGAAGFSLDEETVHFFRAKSVILCTGAGGFKPNGFPICDLTHDGTIMAYNIGAKVTGKEWNDGHPGQSTNAADCFDGWHGMFEQKPSTTSIEIHHDLGVDMNYQAYMLGNPLKMGRPGEGGSKMADGGPVVPAAFQQRRPPERDHMSGEGEHSAPEGRPPKKRPPREEGDGPPGMSGTIVGGSSAGMAIHKSEGVVPINGKCESNIPGLYAAGDALGSYMAGAIYTQIGSSLAGSAVQGAVAGETAAKYCTTAKMPIISSTKVNAIQEEILAPLKREAGYSPAWVTQTLQGVMIPNFVLYIKKESMMKAALAYVEELRDHHIPLLRASDMHELRLAHETANMIISAEMKMKASLMRTESRCSHYRLDYPDTDNENWEAWINIYKGDNDEMKFEKQAFGNWPV